MFMVLITIQQAQFPFCRFDAGNLGDKDTPRSGSLYIVESINKVMEIVESNHHVSTVSITQQLTKSRLKPFK